MSTNFLRYASTKTLSPIYYFDHDYTQIRTELGLQSLRSLILETDYLVSYNIAKHSYYSPEISGFFKRRVISHNLRKFRELEHKNAVPNYIDNSTSFRLRRLWNHLSLDVKNIEKLRDFKREITRIIIEGL